MIPLIDNIAENVTIDGFTLQDEKDVNDEYAATVGVCSEQGNFNAKNNRVIGLPMFGIYVARSAADVTTIGTIVNVEISNNYIKGTALSDLSGTWAHAINLLGTVGDVLNNVIDQSRTGIAIQPYNQPSVEIDEDGLVDGNIFNTYSAGVFNHQGGAWNHYAVSGNWTFSNNEFNLTDTLPAGIETKTTYTAVHTRASEFYFNKSITYINNTFDVSNVGTIGYVKENIEGFTYRNDIFHNFTQQHTAADINFIYTNNTFTSDDFDFYFDRSSGDTYPTYPPMEIDLADIKTDNTFTDGSVIFGDKLVAPSKVNVVNTTQGLGYETIQDAIDAATSGDIINVAAGTYAEAITIDTAKVITLQGAGNATTIIQPTAGLNAITISSIAAQSLTIKDIQLVLSGAGRGIEAADDMSSTTIALENAIINYSQTGRGISFWCDAGDGNNSITLLNSQINCVDADGQSSSANKGINYKSNHSSLTLNNSTVTAGHYAVRLVGDDVTANISNGCVLKGYAALYLLTTDSTINIDNSTLTGRTFWGPVSNTFGTIAFYAGESNNTTVNITNSIITNEWVGDATSYEALILSAGSADFNKVYLDEATQLINTNPNYAPSSILTRGLDFKWYINNVPQGDPERYNIYVDGAVGNDENSGLLGSPKKTIQAAIDATDAGDTIKVAAGTYPEAIELNKPNITVRSIDGAEVTLIDVPAGVLTTGVLIYKNLGDVTFDGFTVQNFTECGIVQSYTQHEGTAAHIQNNRIIPADDYLRNGIQVAGDGSTVISNYVLGARLTADWGGTGIHVVDSSNVTVADNRVIGQSGFGLDIGIAVNSELPCEHIVITGNTIQNVDEAFNMAGYSGGLVNEVAIHNNRISEFVVGVAKSEMQGEGTVTVSNISVTHNWWAADDGPQEGSIMDGVPYSPWFVDAAMTQLVYTDNAIQDDQTIEPDQIVTVSSEFTVGTVEAPVTLTVDGGTLNVGSLNLTEGSVVVVNDGELVLGDGDDAQTIAGTFMIYNSFGSIYIEEDTTFSGGTLALISDIHVAADVTLTVSGALTFDGCEVNSQVPGERFNIAVTESGTFTMVRTELTDATITLSGNKAELRDNWMTDVTVKMTVDATGNRILHNVFLHNVVLVDASSDTVTTLDGWGNPITLAETKNDLSLNLADADANGDIFIQPGEGVAVTMDLNSLDVPVSGLDALMGYNTRFLGDTGTVSVTGADAPWTYDIYEGIGINDLGSEAAVYGLIDKSIGVDLTAPLDGTMDDATTLALDFTSTDEEGVTKVFFRVGTEGDVPADTRLTSAPGGLATYVSPFTMNSGYITVDGTAPLSTLFLGIEEQGETVVNVFDPEVVTEQGTVVIRMGVTDELSGLDAANAVLTITNQVSGTVLASSMMSTHTAGEMVTTSDWQVVIGPSVENGIYDVTAVVADRSGNTVTNIATLEINKTTLGIEVELVSAVTGAFDRDVLIVMTDVGGTVIDSFVDTVSFSSQTGTVSLTQVPEGVAAVSADTDWTLRTKQDVTYDVNGQGSVELPLFGGDLNNDNLVDMLDFTRLRYFWMQATTEADVDGDGAVNSVDYSILRSNWYLSGSEQ